MLYVTWSIDLGIATNRYSRLIVEPPFVSFLAAICRVSRGTCFNPAQRRPFPDFLAPRADDMAPGKPLGLAYEQYSGRQPGGTGWLRALRNWQAICGEIDNSKSSFINSLSTPQKNTLRLLLEWWDEEVDEMKGVAPIKEAGISREAGSTDDEAVKSALRSCSKSPYHRALAKLFATEFLADDPIWSDPGVGESTRVAAGPLAACQRIAYLTSAFYLATPLSGCGKGGISQTPATVPRSFRSAHLPKTTIEACPWIPAEKKRGIPYYLWDIEAQKTIEVASLGECPPYAIISHTWGRWRLPSGEANSTVAIAGIPWPVPRNTKFSVEELPSILQQRAADFTSCKYVWFDLFCIPQDRSELARNEISRQAAIFGEAAQPICWLNSITNWKGLRAAIHFLALRFLTHLGGARAGCPMPAAVEKAASTSTQLFDDFIQDLPNPDKALGLAPCGWFTSLWTLQECCLRPDMTLVDQDWNKLTLFEEPRSPDITLDTLLSVLDFSHKHDLEQGKHPRAVEELEALADATCLFGLFVSPPLAILAAGDKRQCTGRRAEAIMSVVGATDWYVKLPPELHEKDLILGRYPIQFLREVREKQGAAFFASLYGWHCAFWDIFDVDDDVGDENDEEDHESDENEDDEVDEKELPEASKNAGDTDEIGGEDDSDDNEDGEDDWEDFFEFKVKVAGTMLPFDPFHTTSKIVVGGATWTGLPATETWQLGDDARVLMRDVPIIASTDPGLDDQTHRMVRATVMSPKNANPKEMQDLRGANLHGCLKTMFAGQSFANQPRHAIPVLWKEGGWVQGVILMKVFEQEEPSKTFAKIGDFIIEGITSLGKIREHAVDWEVL